jgi:signal transduction histidine kinase
VPYITLFGAVAISVYLGGWGPAALAAGLGYTIVHRLYALPAGAWSLGGPAQAVQFVLFGFSCALIIGLGEGMRRARDRHRLAEAEARERAAAVQRARQAAEAAERHASFLSEVTAILGASLDYDTTLARVTRLAIPTLADLCAVDLVEPDGRIRRVATAHVDPAKEALVADLRIVHGFNPDAPHGVPAVVRTRRPVLVAHATEQELAIAARNAEQLEMFRTLALKSWIIVPLIARDQVLGALTFVITESARRYTPADVTFAESVANRAAVAIDNARLYREADTARLVAESASAAAHRAQREAEIFGEVTAAITASLELATVLERVVNGAKELCNADIGRIALREPDTDRMVFRYSAGSRLGTRHPAEIDRGQGLGGHVWRTGQPYRTADHRVDPYRHRTLAGLLEEEGTVTSLVVPIRLRDHVEGLIYLDRRSSAPFTERDEELVGRFADHAAVAIQNAHLLAAEKTARAEAEVANRAKDEFLAVLSHELRTPLNAVYGWARMLRAGDVRDDGRDRALDVIIRNANAQVQLIDDLLDISRVVTGKMRLDMRRVDLTRVVESALDAVRPAAEAKAIRLETVLDPDAGPVAGDPGRLEQVVWNLVMNAVKFTPGGGRIQVDLRRVNARVEIVVADTGRGIAPDVLPFIFDRFRQGDSSSTRAHGGLGLGLALVKHLVELHGGTVAARSPGEGQGATFVVSLPLTTAEPGAPGDRRQSTARSLDLPPTARLAGLRILVVDDDRDAIDLASAILAAAGATVTSAGSAREAFETFRTWRPDVIVSDIEMPEEDGYTLIRKIRSLDEQDRSEIPAVALTAYGRPHDRALALTAGFNMHVRKPVDPAELTMIIASLVSR